MYLIMKIKKFKYIYRYVYAIKLLSNTWITPANLSLYTGESTILKQVIQDTGIQTARTIFNKQAFLNLAKAVLVVEVSWDK